MKVPESVIVAVIACQLFGTAQSDTDQVLVRTTISEHRVGSLSGRWLKLDPQWGTPVRAWAGVVERGHRESLSSDLQRRVDIEIAGLVPPQSREFSDEELLARKQHLARLKIHHFDRVLVEVISLGQQQTVRLWLTDRDIDGDLADEQSELGPESFQLVPGFTVMLPESLTNQSDTLTLKQLASQPAIKPKSQPLSGDRSSGDMFTELLMLDEPSVRKRNLPDIVSLATAIIAAIDESADAEKLPVETQDVLIQTLYRKGRALGYMELPDVVAVQPIQDQVALNDEFEATFRRLSQLVDTTQPDYILLAIRRQRRLRNYGQALDLVGLYRKRHPNPVWFEKKRRDLLSEMEAPLSAHQASIDLWLKGAMPGKPIPVVLRTGGITREALNSVTFVSYGQEPWQPPKLHLLRQRDRSLEAVIWLQPKTTLAVDCPDLLSTTPLTFVVPSQETN